jgi:putative thioredoxin
MKKEVYIFEVSEKSFDESVIQNSHTLPVFVEFIGFWSEPCVLMSDVFSDLATEFAGQFIFAKVDIDEHPELRKKYNVENIPCLKIFVNGDVVNTEEGQFTEEECRVLLKQHNVFHESDEMRLQARELHLSGDTQAAFILLTDAIKTDPQNTRIALDMVQIFLDTQLIDNANGLFNKLPSSVKESEIGQSLSRQLAFANQAAKTEGIHILQQRIEQSHDDFDAHFDMSICQIAEYETLSAIKHLFYILERSLDYKEGAAKELLIVLIGILKEKEPDVAKETQQQLNNLFAT